jgi:general secretion pathway protein K
MRHAAIRQGGSRTQRGAVLVLVLWILTLLTFLLGAFSNEIRVENRIVGDMVERIRLRAGATAVLNYLALAGSASPEALGSFEGVPLTLALANSSVNYRLVPEEAYVSLNAAPPEMLRALISNYPGGVDDVDALVDALVDWRDGDDIVTGSGAEAAQYSAAGFAYGPRNAPLQSVDELGQVLGFTPELVDWLRSYVSVASMSPGIDAHFADPQLVLMLDPEGKLSADDVAAMQADPTVADSMALENAFFSATRSGAYRVLVEGSGAMGLKRRQALEVIVAFDGMIAVPPQGMEAVAAGPPPSPYRIIQWNEFPPLAVDGATEEE